MAILKISDTESSSIYDKESTLEWARYYYTSNFLIKSRPSSFSSDKLFSAHEIMRIIVEYFLEWDYQKFRTHFTYEIMKRFKIDFLIERSFFAPYLGRYNVQSLMQKNHLEVFFNLIENDISKQDPIDNKTSVLRIYNDLKGSKNSIHSSHFGGPSKIPNLKTLFQEVFLRNEIETTLEKSPWILWDIYELGLTSNYLNDKFEQLHLSYTFTSSGKDGITLVHHLLPSEQELKISNISDEFKNTPPRVYLNYTKHFDIQLFYLLQIPSLYKQKKKNKPGSPRFGTSPIMQTYSRSLCRSV